MTVSGCESGPAARLFLASAPTVRDTTLILHDGQPLSTIEARARAGEIAGGLVVEEMVLERELERACARAGVSFTPEDIAREREDLVASIEASDSAGTASAVTGLIDTLRAQRGLGPRRFEALLRRNAMLRALVRGDVDVSEGEILLAHRIRHGERRVVRVIVMPTQSGADAARDRVVAGAFDGGLVRAFADEARHASTHPSAAGGGWIGAVSVLDPAYPEALRSVIVETGDGTITGLVSMGARWGFAMVERTIAADGPAEPTDADGRAIEHEIRRRKERLAMERLASRLVRDADTVVVDPSYGWSFRHRTGGDG